MKLKRYFLHIYMDESLQTYDSIIGTLSNLTIEKNKETLQESLNNLLSHIFRTKQSDMYKWYKFKQSVLKTVEQFDADFGSESLDAQYFISSATTVNEYINQTSAIDDKNNEKIKDEKSTLLLKLQTLQKQLVRKAKEVKKTEEDDI